MHGKTDNAHILHSNVLINWQLSKQGLRWPVSPDCIAGSGVDHRGWVFFEVLRWQVTSFQMIAGSSFYIIFKIYMKYVVFICRTIKILISHWPRTRKFSQLLQAGKTVAFDFSHHGHALVTFYVQFFLLWLVKIWQVSSCGKFMQHLETCLTAEADRVLCQLVMFLTAFFHWMYKLKFSCY